MWRLYSLLDLVEKVVFLFVSCSFLWSISDQKGVVSLLCARAVNRSDSTKPACSMCVIRIKPPCHMFLGKKIAAQQKQDTSLHYAGCPGKAMKQWLSSKILDSALTANLVVSRASALQSGYMYASIMQIFSSFDKSGIGLA